MHHAGGAMVAAAVLTFDGNGGEQDLTLMLGQGFGLCVLSNAALVQCCMSTTAEARYAERVDLASCSNRCKRDYENSAPVSQFENDSARTAMKSQCFSIFRELLASQTWTERSTCLHDCILRSKTEIRISCSISLTNLRAQK